MNIRDNIPNKLFENPNVDSFISVLDSLNEYKQSVISEAVRVNNPVLCTNGSWLIKALEEYGITGFTNDYPIFPLQQILLNAQTFTSLRGSKKGVEFYCSVLSLGEVTVDDSNFYGEYRILLLDSIIHGTLLGDNKNDLQNFLVGDSKQVALTPTLRISIATQYCDNPLVTDYIGRNLPSYLGYAPGKDLNITFTERDNKYYHPLLNGFFYE